MTDQFDSAEYILYPYFTAEKFKTNPAKGTKACAVISWEIAKNKNINDLVEKYLGNHYWHFEGKLSKNIIQIHSAEDISAPLSKLISETTPYQFISPEKLELILKRVYDFDLD